MEQVKYQDYEWANDWKVIVEIFDTIDVLKSLFDNLDVTYLREVQQKILILNLEKYACSLQNYIIEKYSKDRS
ncbi:hypothetical protein LCGC14_0939340 [marine sediment metagenome]|uniref:Uncharacterized protein n=1 Tax=marine sediment metagenome TaxID=412755 RepID=A0A0F9NQ62_9ZZZZ|nr:hypothetical protein [archaeon]